MQIKMAASGQNYNRKNLIYIPAQPHQILLSLQQLLYLDEVGHYVLLDVHFTIISGHVRIL